jgi:hypothetical protein
MADGRILSKRISRSNRVAQLKNDTQRMIYTWLIPYLDVEGRLEAQIDLLKADIAPLLKHITPRIIGDTLKELHAVGLIILYDINDKQYLQLTQFEPHQKNLRKDREASSVIPPPLPEQLRSDAGVTPESLHPSRARAEVKRSLREDNIRALFEKFWTEYPKKKSKGQAEKAWIKNIHSDEQLLEKIFSKIEEAKKSEEWLKEGGKYIPYPATWLNAKGWEDEYTTVPQNNGNGSASKTKYGVCPSCGAEVEEFMLTEFACLKCEPRAIGVDVQKLIDDVVGGNGSRDRPEIREQKRVDAEEKQREKLRKQAEELRKGG